MTHTPGPWTARTARSDWEETWGPAITSTDGVILASVDERFEADARLIAAAPDLLEALRDVVRTYDDDHDTIRTGQLMEYRAAIAKATGTETVAP